MIQTILIAESDSDLREQLKWCLRTAGYQVVTAQHRIEAMAALMSRRINLMLLEAAMAGADSRSVLQQVSAGGQFDRVPILMMANDTASAPREFPVLVKPIDARELLQMVNGMIGPPARANTLFPPVPVDGRNKSAS